MPTPFVLVSGPIQIGKVKLGSLVPDVGRPHIDAFAPVSLPEDDVLISEQRNFQALLERGKHTAFEACVSRLATASFDGSANSYVGLSAHKAMSYEMRSPLSFFKEISAHEHARLWLQDAIAQGRKSYIITGLRTLFDASVMQGNTSSRGGGAAASVPLGAILAGGPDPTGGTADVGMSGKAGTEVLQQMKYLAPDEQIYAVQFRKITFKWFFSRSVDAAFLDTKNRWKVLGEEVRGPAGEEQEDEEGDEDVVEADLLDDAQIEYDGSMSAARDGEEEYLAVPEGHQL